MLFFKTGIVAALLAAASPSPITAQIDNVGVADSSLLVPSSVSAQFDDAVVSGLFNNAANHPLDRPLIPPPISAESSTAASLSSADNTLIVTYSSEVVLAAITAQVDEHMSRASVKAVSQFKRPQKISMHVQDDAKDTSNAGTLKGGRAPNRYHQASDPESTIMGYVVVITAPEMTDQQIDMLFGIEGVMSVERDVVYVAFDASSRHEVTSAMDHVSETYDVLANKHVNLPPHDTRQLNTNKELHPDRRLQEYTPYGITMVNVTQLWSIAHLEKVKICIVDTGYDLGHPDLPGTAHGITGWDTGQATKGIWNIDKNSHGTHVAGTIGAIGSNNQGVVGVNPSPERFSFHIGKGLTDSNSGSSVDVVAAVQSCASNGAKVISMSLGGPHYSAWGEAVFRDIYDSGILVIAAAGNDGSKIMGDPFINNYPAAYKTVMSVSSVSEGGIWTTALSAVNYQVEISAPGDLVWSTIPRSMGSFAQYSGTSMACPHVAGVAALLISHFPSCTNNQIRNAMIRATTEPPVLDVHNAPGWDKYYGWGIVNAGRAYELLKAKGCEGAGGANPNVASGISLADQALGGKNQKQLACTSDDHCIGARFCGGMQKCDLTTNTCYVVDDPCVDDGPFTLQAPYCSSGDNCYIASGLMFDVKAKINDISITSMRLHLYIGSIGEVWTREGTHVGHEYSQTGWTKVAIYDYSSASYGSFWWTLEPHVTFAQPIDIPASLTQAFYVTFLSGGQFLIRPGYGTVAEDDNIVIYDGPVFAQPFNSVDDGKYSWTGAVIYKTKPISPQPRPTTSPTTRKPTTRKPTTRKPTTRKPTTRKPSTRKPSTRKPTRKPSTRKPTTRKPTS